MTEARTSRHESTTAAQALWSTLTPSASCTAPGEGLRSSPEWMTLRLKRFNKDYQIGTRVLIPLSAAGGEGCRSACVEEYNETDQTATVHLEYIPDLIEPAFVEIDLKRNKVRLIFTRCEDAANRYDFNSKFNDHVKTL